MEAESQEIESLLAESRRGEPGADDKLFRLCERRLMAIVRRVKLSYDRLDRWEQTEDVFQEVAIKLFEEVRSRDYVDARHFYRSAALIVRRTMIDMARHHFGPEGAARQHQTQAAGRGGDSESRLPYEGGSETHRPDTLAEWSDFHQLVEGLDDDSREMFDLLYYHGLTQEEAATVLDASARTVRRRWRAAKLELAGRLAPEQPGKPK
ncbi:sigma-70 family RNA polymerase sigma factor [Stratiformator vulcanicus]|uniref:RNA polymerase sigma factor n=1 Tax=Stratiformator vulcanicus TaxID=2527980 RepID=A0A517R4D8_9PLAN|nr:sigma-70 family RNA polymerase sigma factor [Stratiformator vulcanicus]QDT38731.1 RNA polymerase sigma factor [Stratiformator vulcanicus]